MTRREAARTAVQPNGINMAPAPATPLGAATHPASLRPADAGTIRFRRLLVRAALVCVAALSVLPRTGEVQAGERFVVESTFAAGHARWLGVDGDLVAFGSGNLVMLVRGEAAAPAVVSRLELDRTVDQAVLAGDRLWVAGPDGGLASIALGRPGALSEPVALDPPVRGALRLAWSDDHLFVAEDGLGLRIVRLPGHRAARGHEGHHSTAVEQDGLLELDASFSAVAAAGHRAWLALPGGSVLVVDAAGRTRPSVARSLELGFEVTDLAANGETLYALGADGTLRVLEPGDAETLEVVARLDVPGASEVDVAGRTIRFAAGQDGLTTVLDTSSTKAIINISVGDLFFSPRNVTVNLGDTVTWVKPTTSFLHNVESCDGVSDPVFCAGEVATEGLFRSGNTTTAAFNFSHLFDAVGGNPYFCVLHVAGGMNGRVDVTLGTSSGPPPVPDGATITGTQLRASRLTEAGDSVSVSWDTTTCPGAVDYHIVYGVGSQLPAAPGGAFAVGGGRCAIGTTSPFTWTNVPDPAADTSRLLWWIVVANDGEGTEGSWGPDAAGNERVGPGPGGSSAQCAISAKDLSDTCGL